MTTSSSAKIRVLDPMGYPPRVEQKTMAPRLDQLDGKTIYFVDPQFDDSGLFLHQLEKAFNQRLPKVKTKFVRMTRVYGHDDPDTWKKIQADGDAAIIGVGH
jgi:hypothetical protein